MDIAPGLPAFNVVGLPDAAIQEARDRVRAAIRNSDCSFPMRRITVNLAPAELKKEGGAYDLPMAVAILVATEQVPPPAAPLLFLGELSLDGALRHTQGILPMVSLAREHGLVAVVVPAINAGEAALICGPDMLPTRALTELIAHLRGEVRILPHPPLDGLPDAAIQEPRDRVRTAIRNSDCSFPMRRITVNLAPAELKKEGAAYDLPIIGGPPTDHRAVPAARRARLRPPPRPVRLGPTTLRHRAAMDMAIGNPERRRLLPTPGDFGRGNQPRRAC